MTARVMRRGTYGPKHDQILAELAPAFYLICSPGQGLGYQNIFIHVPADVQAAALVLQDWDASLG